MKPGLLIAVFLCTSLIIGCDPGPPNLPDAVEKCEGACLVFEHFECEAESEGGNHELCVSKCERVASLGYVWTDDKSGPECIVRVKTLDELRSCNVRCER